MGWATGNWRLNPTSSKRPTPINYNLHLPVLRLLSAGITNDLPCLALPLPLISCYSLLIPLWYTNPLLCEDGINKICKVFRYEHLERIFSNCGFKPGGKMNKISATLPLPRDMPLTWVETESLVHYISSGRRKQLGTGSSYQVPLQMY